MTTAPVLAAPAATRRSAARPVVLLLLPHYLPGYRYGGPVRSVANLVEALGGEYAFRVASLDRDLGDAAPYAGIEPNRWHPSGSGEALYLPPSRGLGPIVRLLRDTPHDVLHLHSLLSPSMTQRPLLARRLGLAPAPPLILAPHGELSPGALALKPRRKAVFLALAARVRLHAGALWHATDGLEAADIQRAMGPVPTRVAGNLTRLTRATPPPAPAPGGPLRVVFLSRISPMKNLDFALRALALARAPIRFTVVGPVGDPEHLAQCRALAEALPPHISVEWRGAVLPEAVPEALAGHDLFLLPTRGENFGHVIAEALAAGLPLLLSDRTPWRGLGAAGVGRDLPLDDPAPFAAYIDEVAAMPTSERAALSARVAAYASDRLRPDDAIEAHRALFRAALEQGPLGASSPGC